jgi:hypothetical protein
MALQSDGSLLSALVERFEDPLLAAAGLILPAAFDVVPVLVPLAAVGLALLMVGAILTHARRAEFSNIGVNVVLLATAAVVAWGRIGHHEF